MQKERTISDHAVPNTPSQAEIDAYIELAHQLRAQHLATMIAKLVGAVKGLFVKSSASSERPKVHA